MNKNNGITLISLVITIIILLILAGVSIGLLFSENGIISQTNRATIINEFATYKEQISVGMLADYTIEDGVKLSGILKQAEVKKYIQNMNEEYIDNIYVLDNEMIFVGETSEELSNILEELDIKRYTEEEFLDIEYQYKYKETIKVGVDTNIPPEDGKWETNGIEISLGDNSKYNEEKQVIEQTAGVGTSKYLQTDPFYINYDESFTIEYSFKMNNLGTNVGDIQMMSIQGVNPAFEHILFYTYSYSSTKPFSMYSQVNGLLNGNRNITDGLTPSPLILDHVLITLALVYDVEEGKVKQYVNGKLNKEESIQGNLSGEQLVTWSNTRHNTASNGISGEVYRFTFYEERLTDEELESNYNYDKIKYKS